MIVEYHELYREDTPVVFIQPSTHLDCGFASTAARVNVTWEFEPFEDNDPTLEMLSTTVSVNNLSKNATLYIYVILIPMFIFSFLFRRILTIVPLTRPPRVFWRVTGRNWF